MGVKVKAVFTNVQAGYCVTVYKDGKLEYFGHFSSRAEVKGRIERKFGPCEIEFTTLKKGDKYHA